MTGGSGHSAMGGPGVGGPQVGPQPPPVDREKMYQWIIELASPDTRENALLELRLVKQSVLCSYKLLSISARLSAPFLNISNNVLVVSIYSVLYKEAKYRQVFMHL